MSFASDIEDDFVDILGGEFSRRVVITSRATGEQIDTRGIYDETLEAIEQQDGMTVNSMFTRVTLHTGDFTFTPKQYDFIDIYPYGNDSSGYVRFRIHSYEPESEKTVVIPLTRDD